MKDLSNEEFWYYASKLPDPLGVAEGLRLSEVVSRRRVAYEHAYEPALEELQTALHRCGTSDRLVCVELRLLAGFTFAALGHTSRAIESLQTARESARRVGDMGLEGDALESFGFVYLSRDDLRGGFGDAAQSYYREHISWTTDCSEIQSSYEQLAMSYLNAGDLPLARRTLGEPRAARGRCSQEGESTNALFVRAQTLTPEDRDQIPALRSNIQRLRKAGDPTLGLTALLDYVEGVALVNVGQDEGAALLDRAIDGVREAPESALARRIGKYARRARVVAAAQDRPQEAINLLATHFHTDPGSPCTLGVAADRMTVVVGRDADGEMFQDAIPSSVWTMVPGNQLVSAGIRERLLPCAKVRVLALTPYFGASRLLPSDQAWSHRASLPIKKLRPDLEGTRLVVANPRPPSDLGLPELGTVPRTGGGQWLEGSDATPGQVLHAIPRADVIEIHTHGVVGTDEQPTLVLSPDANGEYRLKATDLQPGSLPRAPVVLLAACDAGRSRQLADRTTGLVDAFLLAGARAVIAATTPIPDRDAASFFAALSDRIRSGEAPSKALRDGRLGQPETSWVHDVVVFE